MDRAYQRTPSCSAWVYIQSEPNLYGSRDEAAARVRYLNGGTEELPVFGRAS